MRTPSPFKRATATLLALALTAPAVAQEPIDYAALAKIRTEARANSQIMSTLHVLTDVYGPRLTGSPNHKAAAEWVIRQTTAWGFENAHLEPWDFSHPGWLNERFSGFIVSPVKDSLVGEVLAWTPGTNGTAKGRAVRIEPPQCPSPSVRTGPASDPCPTRAELLAALDLVRAKVKGAMVLVGPSIKVPVTLTPPAARGDDEDLRLQFDPDRAAPSRSPGPRPTPSPDPSRLTANQITEVVNGFLVEAGALVRVNDAGREHGQIRAFHNRTFDVTKAVPTVVLRNEDYGRISRLLDGGAPVDLEFTIVNHTYPEGKTSYNVVAEIPGADKRNEVVMLGGHLDSWHAATGATDNAIGSAIMMEAARIIKATGLKPRRTIRLALWSGEEQGLLGSKAYVKEHFGTFEDPKPEFSTFNGYINVDSGTGRIRGATVFGPEAAATFLREVLAPFEDLGLLGAASTDSRRAGGTDSTSFNAAGLPGIGLRQDPIQYGSHTWHTNLDTYERILEEDAIRSATAIAGAVYHLATREEKVPRFTKEQMPPPPPTPTP